MCLRTRLEKGGNSIVDITYTLLSTQQEIRLAQLDPAYQEEEIEGGTASGEESESGEVRESTSTPTEDNQSDEQDEKGSDDEFEQAFGSGDDDNNNQLCVYNYTHILRSETSIVQYSTSSHIRNATYNM